MRLLGIDYGTRHIGLAIGDTDANFALPLDSVTFDDEARVFEILRETIKAEGIEAIAIGVPMSGEHPAQQKITEEFVGRLKKEISLPINVIDETMTSREAQVRLLELGTKAKNDHAVAAMLILQHFLDGAV